MRVCNAPPQYFESQEVGGHFTNILFASLILLKADLMSKDLYSITYRTKTGVIFTECVPDLDNQSEIIIFQFLWATFESRLFF